MKVLAANKFSLRDLHQEIDLFDRKIAHLNNFEKFESEDEKRDALDKLTTKREKLVKTARELVANGIEFEAKDLPRSFRSEAENASAKEVQSAAAAKAEPAKPQSDFGMKIDKAEAEQRNA